MDLTVQNNLSVTQFRDLLLERSARLLNASPCNLDEEISKELKFLGESLQFEWNTLGEFSGDSKIFNRINTYFAPSVNRPSISTIQRDTEFLTEKVSSGQTVFLRQLPNDLPREAKWDRDFCIDKGIKSSLALPLKLNNSVLGALYFASLRSEQSLPEKVIDDLNYFSGILASLIDRKRAAEKANESMRFEKYISNISTAYSNLQANEIKNVIRRDLGDLGQILGADKCFLYLISEDKLYFKLPGSFFWLSEENINIKKKAKNRVMEDSEPRDLRFLFNKWLKGESVLCNNLYELPDDAKQLKQVCSESDVKSFISIPISISGSVACTLFLSSSREYRWPNDVISRLRPIGEIYANALVRNQSEEKLRNTVTEIEKLKKEIRGRSYCKDNNFKPNFHDIIGKSKAIGQVLLKVKHVAVTNATVLLLGETGTGKGIIAKAIHNAGTRRDMPLIQVNCASLAPNLIESELFGHEKGAFTGAQTRRAGCFERAKGTTLFLDEIGELPPESQAKLLRVLQEWEFERVGGSETIKTDARIIAATNRDIEKEVEAGRFRRDLWYRLNIFPIYIPPLRERPDDISYFIEYFISKYANRLEKRFNSITPDTINALKGYSWPGNIRELENLIARAVIESTDENLKLYVPANRNVFNNNMTLNELERSHILETLENTLWRIEGKNGAAKILDMKPSTLRLRMKKLNIRRPKLLVT